VHRKLSTSDAIADATYAGYADYEADRHRRLGKEADEPHRIKYRRLKD